MCITCLSVCISSSTCLCACVHPSVRSSCLSFYTTCLTAVTPARSLPLCAWNPSASPVGHAEMDADVMWRPRCQILHALTGLDCGWASKLPATIRDTSERMGLTSGVSSQIKPTGGCYGHIGTSITAGAHLAVRTCACTAWETCPASNDLFAQHKCLCLCVYLCVIRHHTHRLGERHPWVFSWL